MPFESEAQRRFMYSQHPKLAKEFEAATPDNAELPEHKKKMADGGVVHDMNNPNPEVSDEEKRNKIYNAMGMGKFAVGGLVPPPEPGLAIPDRNDPNFWESIKSALTKVATPITAPMNAANKVVEATVPVAADIGRQMAPPAVAAINQLTGADLPIPEAPKTPDLGTPTPLSQPVTSPSPTPKMPPPPVSAPRTETGSAPAAPKTTGLFDQDTSKLTAGVDAEDRKAVAANMADKQGGLGSIIAQAVAGLGDALAAKGGREQHALKDIFTMQKQQRDEALANFDKERQSRIEQLTLKTQMGENAIKELAAQDAYGVDENLNRQLGAPAGTKHKDLPLYMQMAGAKAAAAEKDADLRMRSMKQAADDIESAVKNASMFSFKPSAEQMKAQGAKLADQYFHRAKGNVLFHSSDGQKVWIPAKNVGAAQKMDPNGKVVQ